MQETIQSFTDYLQTEKKASKNTEVSYQRDLRAGTLLPGNDLAQHCGDSYVLPICMSGGKNGI